MKKKGIRSLFVIALVLLSGYLLIGNPIVFWHNWELKRSIQSIEPERKMVAFNNLVPFEWDRVYTFAPYTSKKEIAEVIGFHSRSIRETVSEGMVQLLFVKDHSVTASVCSHVDSLGYQVDFSGSISREEEAVFEVIPEDGWTVLRRVDDLPSDPESHDSMGDPKPSSNPMMGFCEKDWKVLDWIETRDQAFGLSKVLLYNDSKEDQLFLAFIKRDGGYQTVGIGFPYEAVTGRETKEKGASGLAEDSLLSYLGNGGVSLEVTEEGTEIPFTYGMFYSENKDKKEVSFRASHGKISPVPKLKKEQLDISRDISSFLGADGICLDRADEEKLIFHTHKGLFLCRREDEGYKLAKAIDLTALGADQTQGDGASFICADRERVLIMPHRYDEKNQEPTTWEYRFQEGQMRKWEGFWQTPPSTGREEIWKAEEQVRSLLKGESMFCSSLFSLEPPNEGRYGFIIVSEQGDFLEYGSYDLETKEIERLPIVWNT